MNLESSTENKYFKKGISMIIMIIIIYLAIPFLLLVLAIFHSINNDVDFASSLKEIVESTGPLGDTLGGTLGPIVAIIAALLTYWAFMEQVKANRQQAEQFQIQFKDGNRATFENRFFELLAICNLKRNEANSSDQNHDFFQYALRYFEFHRKIYFYTYNCNELDYSNKESFEQQLNTDLENRYVFFSKSIYNIGYPMFFGINNYLSNNNDSECVLYIKSLNSTTDSNSFRVIDLSNPDLFRYYDKFELNEVLHSKAGIYKNIISYLESLRLLLNYISISKNKGIIDSKDMIFFYDIIRNEITEYEALFLFIFQIMQEYSGSFFTKEAIESSNLFQKINMEMLFDYFDPTVGLVPFSSIEEYYATKASLNL
ncbi:hypothetical protein VB776_20215 [Arcicella sp. DC2W]|uniref:Phage abortive infection protein n=1 Tax=Arcicella gelida TaxID=2984195 RepID=A0ABU5SAP2_9BACT|nr:hypothetical protein [Arcicella sp. DC2W]MEA5405273.1 hypothetical protein [Arcicella sp. DC2W]